MELATSDLFYLDKCAVCGDSGSKACGACELEYYCSREHQKEHWKTHRHSCSKYEVKNIDEHGFCMVAKKVISPGETVAAEYPLTSYNSFGGDAVNLQQILALSGSNAYPCPSCNTGKIFRTKCYRCSKCGLPLCKKECESSGTHAELECLAFQKCGAKVELENTSLQEVYTDLAILRIFLREQKKGPTSAISFESPKWNRLLKIIFTEKLQGGDKELSNIPLSDDIIASLDAVQNLPLCLKVIGNKELVILLHCALTTYSISSGVSGLEEVAINNNKKFVYTKNHRLSHSCVPNCEVWIESDESNNKLIIKAIRLIQPGQRLTINKGEEFSSLPTSERRKKLQQTLGINCKCRRCKDPSELGTFISAVRCEENLTAVGCNGHYIAQNPLNENTKWKCNMRSCKSSQSYPQIQNIIRNVQLELPLANGKVDEVLKQLKDFEEYYKGDVLSSSHYLIRVTRSRMRETVNYFLGGGEKLLLCVVNNFPRAYDYCAILLKSIESLMFFVDKINPTFNELRGQLLYEKGTANLAKALNEFLVLRKLKTNMLIVKLELVLKDLKDAATAISIFTYPSAKSLRDDINFMGSIIKKILNGPSSQALSNTKNPLQRSVEIDKKLDRAFSAWKIRSREIGLVTYYMEPSSKERFTSKQDLREIIASCL